MFLTPRSFNETRSWLFLLLRNSVSSSKILCSLREYISWRCCSRSTKPCIALMAFSYSPSNFFNFCSEFSICFWALHNFNINCFLVSSCRFNSLSRSSNSCNSKFFNISRIILSRETNNEKEKEKNLINLDQLPNLFAIPA